MGLWWFLPAAGQLLTAMHSLRFLPLVVALLSALLPSRADQLMPQDGWIYEGKKFLGTFRSVCVGKDDRLYVGSTNKVAVLDKDLNFLFEFGSFTNVICGIACDSQTNIYVLEPNRVQVFDPYAATPSTALRSWGGAGTNTGQFQIITEPNWNFYGNGTVYNPTNGSFALERTASGLSLSPSDEVYVADGSNRRIQVFDRMGNFLRKWGQLSDSPVNPLLLPTSVLVTSRNKVVVYSGITGTADAVRLDVYSTNGVPIVLRNFVEVHTTAAQYSAYNLSTTPDGLLVGSPDNLGNPTSIRLYDVENLGILQSFTQPSLRLGGPTDDFRIDGQAFGRDGRWYCAIRYGRSGPDAPGLGFFGDGLFLLERQFSAGRPLAAKSVPQPSIRSLSQRSGASLVDIDFRVFDSDSTAVQVAVLGFTNGVNTLSGLIRMSTFADGTATNLGANIPANTTRRVTWDPATDWNFGFGNIQFEVLAKDERGLFPFHFITVPASGVNPAIKVSDVAPTDADFLSLWFWLVATSDSAVVFTNFEVFGTGANVGVKFATGTTTTAAGRTYLLARLGVRAITAAEVTQANSGRFGFPATVTTSHVVKLP